MASSRPSVRSRVRPSPVHKHFTLEQANRTLPLVSRIVRDIVAAHQTASQLQAELQRRHGDAGVETALEKAVERLQALVGELHDVGCELKDYQMGLVDFLGRNQGRNVFLCWRLGEERITHWHEVDAGFAARQGIDTLNETA